MSSKTQAPVNTTTKPSLNADKSGLLQRKCACGNSAGLTGKCTTCQTEKLTLQRKQTAAQDKVSEVPPISHEALSLPRVPFIQAKLTIGASDDPLEREADQIAHQVMAAPSNPTVSDTPPRIQRFTGQPTGNTDMAAPASVDRVLSSPGRPLEPALQQDMGQRLGHDFSQVRVHTDAAAERSAREVNANAYTVGHNIVFGVGQFAPGTNAGRRLVAHELTHVVQQLGEQKQQILQRKEENNVGLAEIQGLPMYDLLTRLSKLPENIIDDEEAGGLVGGSRLVTAMRAVKAKMQKDIDFLTNNKRGIQALPPDQAVDILNFLSLPNERTSQKTINTDLEIDITIVAPHNIRLPGENQGTQQSENTLSPKGQSLPEAISDFEESLLDDRNIITGVVLDPETREIIGYRTSYADGISRLVDREGEFVVDAGIPLGVESEDLGPFDYLPSPKGIVKGAGKAAAGVAGKLIVKGALKKGAASGGKVTLGAIVKMRSAARAIAKKAKLGVSSVWPKHHAFPKYLGGAADQTLKKIPRKLHYRFHNALDKFKGGIYDRRLTAKHFESMDKTKVIKDLTEFYRTAEGGIFKKYLPDFLQAVEESGF